jgi:two-component system, NtrC family, sensor kinase
MSLKIKVTLILLAVFLVSGGTSFAVNQLVIVPSFAALEQEEAKRNVERALEALDRELEALSNVVVSWASWDDAKQFVLTGNKTFAETNLNPETVANAEVNYMGYYDLTGALTGHVSVDIATKSPLDVGELLDPRLPKDHPLLQHREVHGQIRGFLSTPAGPILVASRSVLTTSGEGPSAGVLVHGRLFDAERIELIAKQTKLKLTCTPAATSPAANKPIISEALGTQAHTGVWHTPIRLVEYGSTLSGLTTIADVHGKPIFKLRVPTPRHISERGAAAAELAMITFVGVALVILLVLSVLLHHTVVGPLAKLTAHAVEVGAHDNFQERLRLKRKDEIGVLAAELDRMTDRLSEARRHLIDQSFESGKAEVAAGVLHNIGNAITPINIRLHNVSDRLTAVPTDDIEMAVNESENKDTPSDRHKDLMRFVQILAGELAVLVKRTRDDLSSVTVQIVHVQNILNEQQESSRATPILEAIEMEQVVRQAADGLVPEFQRAIAIDIDPSVRAVGAVSGAWVIMQQVVSNLLVNAVESIISHRAAGGRVIVRAVEENVNGKRMAHIAFEDNGGGIEGASLTRIFERGFSTKSRGSGLGLHWSANAVAAHGGRLFAESHGAGQGACLHLVLPLARETPGRMPMVAVG